MTKKSLDWMMCHYNAKLRDLEQAKKEIQWFHEVEEHYLRDWMMHCRP